MVDPTATSLIAAFAAVTMLAAGLPAAAAAAPLCAACCHQARIQPGDAPLAACCRVNPSSRTIARQTDAQQTAPVTARSLPPGSIPSSRDSHDRAALVSGHRLRAMRSTVLRI